ncbi:MAG: hypothetical protein ISS47_01470 [Candidatus Omnitrophica bacterium]|nr:hypothetical protein [Candidatus Omnitrophota bacterium]
MKDVLFLIPLYYTDNFVERFAKYLKENSSKYTADTFICCSNPSIFETAKKRCQKYGFHSELRGNFGGGEGALWYLQKKASIDLKEYRYMWYFEESCEPIKYNWFTIIIDDMEKDVSLAGWDWHFKGKRRPRAIRHVIRGKNGNEMIAYENTEGSGSDSGGYSFNKIWDTPGYRNETFVVQMSDFLRFDYPNATDAFWENRNGIRSYGVRAERMWWDMKYKNIHGFKYHSPNIQWYILNKYNYVPSKENIYFHLFRELPWNVRKDSHYKPRPVLVRSFWNRIKRRVPV